MHNEDATYVSGHVWHVGHVGYCVRHVSFRHVPRVYCRL
jgi:hypothetical protein